MRAIDCGNGIWSRGAQRRCDYFQDGPCRSLSPQLPQRSELVWRRQIQVRLRGQWRYTHGGVRIGRVYTAASGCIVCVGLPVQESEYGLG